MYNGRVCCAVTGAGGYIGSAICTRLQHAGVAIVEFNRRGEPSQADRRAVPFELGGPVNPADFNGIDVLIHCAYDFSVLKWKEIERTNVQGAKTLLAAAHAGGVQRIILISTISAFEGCHSLYGRAKLEIEHDAKRYGSAIVRPGLVYDSVAPRGIVGALAKVVERSPIVPLVGGKSVLYPCHIDDLTQLVYLLCSMDSIPATPVIASSRQGITFKAILQAMAHERGKSPVFIPVPVLPVLATLRLAEAAGLRTRLRSDSLISLVNQSTFVDFRGLAATGVPFRGLVLEHGAPMVHA